MNKSEFPDIDWTDKDVIRVMEIFNEKFNTMAEENKQQAEKIKQQDEEIKQLKQKIEDLTSDTGNRSSSIRSYNVREFKDYPRHTGSTKRHRRVDVDNDTGAYVVQQMEKDIKYCPECGEPLAKSYTEHKRTVEDIIDGKWTKTKWNIMRRNCKKCNSYKMAVPDGVLPGERFGTIIMSQVFVMRMLVVSYEKIQKLIRMFYGRSIAVQSLIHMCNTVAEQCEPLYEDLKKQIADARVINGDDTGWYYNKSKWSMWVFVSANIVLFHLAHSRSKMVPEAILEEFEGIIVGDSHSSWNDIGSDKQRCLLHYFRNMLNTKTNNTSPEYVSFFTELRSIFKDAIEASTMHAENAEISGFIVQELLGRIDGLIDGTYQDTDCRRFVKLLRRERDQLLTFLIHDDVEYHNNIGERMLRIIALMRKVSYGSRGESGIKTLEILATIYSTCEMRGINSYTFMRDYLDGKIDSIPEQKVPQADVTVTT